MLKVQFKKGFVLMEAIVVIVVISVALLTLFASYNKILGKLKEENKFDLSEYLYKTYYIKNYLNKYGCVSDVYSLGDGSGNLKDYNSSTCEGILINNFFSSFNVKKIYILKNINGTDTEENLKNFDAYMIDYIKQLDVDDNASLIIVEYSKTVRDSNYNPVKLYGTETKLTETYIASLEW